MYSRLLTPPHKSFFLFGPRSTGKSFWVRQKFQDGLYFDLLESDLYTDLLASPQRLELKIPENYSGWIILDEIQKMPELLDEVHRLIERKKFKFILTGSSARKLKKKGVNLLAGRALTRTMHPLTSLELEKDFNLKHSLLYGCLPPVYQESDPKGFLKSYIKTFLKEEVQQEGFTRNLGAFSRFLEAASFSQGSVLNITTVAQECAVERKVVENYFIILEDLLLAERIPVFTKRAKRKIVSHPKFYFFDAGVYRALRPQGPLDSAEELDGIALETLIYQEMRALNAYFNWEYQMYYWRTTSGLEVDFILYGPQKIVAIEVKKTSRLTQKEFRGLKAFLEDYPMATAYMIYGGRKSYLEGKIQIISVFDIFKKLCELLGNSSK